MIPCICVRRAIVLNACVVRVGPMQAECSLISNSGSVPCLLINCMKQSLSWEAYSRSAAKGIHCLPWDPKVRCRGCKSPPPVTLLRQMNLFHMLTFTCWSFIFILYLRLLRSRKWPLFLNLSNWNDTYASFFHATCPSFLTLFYLINLVILKLNKIVSP